MTTKANHRSKPRRGPQPPKANCSRELRDSEYMEVLQESGKIDAKRFKVIDSIAL